MLDPNSSALLEQLTDFTSKFKVIILTYPEYKASGYAVQGFTDGHGKETKIFNVNLESTESIFYGPSYYYAKFSQLRVPNYTLLNVGFIRILTPASVEDPESKSFLFRVQASYTRDI